MKLKVTKEGYHTLMNDRGLHAYCIHKPRVEVPAQDQANVNPGAIQLLTMDSQTAHCGDHCPFFFIKETSTGDVNKKGFSVELRCSIHLVEHVITEVDLSDKHKPNLIS